MAEAAITDWRHIIYFISAGTFANMDLVMQDFHTTSISLLLPVV